MAVVLPGFVLDKPGQLPWVNFQSEVVYPFNFLDVLSGERLDPRKSTADASHHGTHCIGISTIVGRY